MYLLTTLFKFRQLKEKKMETILSHLREAVGLGYSGHTIRLGESPMKSGHTKSRPRSPLHSHRTVTVATGRRS